MKLALAMCAPGPRVVGVHLRRPEHFAVAAGRHGGAPRRVEHPHAAGPWPRPSPGRRGTCRRRARPRARWASMRGPIAGCRVADPQARGVCHPARSSPRSTPCRRSSPSSPISTSSPVCTPAPLVRHHDVRLHHDGHPGGEREVGDRGDLTARRADDRRQATADEAVEEVVARREPGVLDDARRRDDVRRGRAGAQDGEDRVERRVGGRVELAVERRRLGGDGERPQELARVVHQAALISQVRASPASSRRADGHCAGTAIPGAAMLVAAK